MIKATSKQEEHKENEDDINREIEEIEREKEGKTDD